MIMAKQNELKYKRFGRLLVLMKADSNRNGIRWLCRCDCGVTKVIPAKNMVSGRTLSCGCLQKEAARKNTKHGHNINGRHTRTYSSWHDMRRRCRDKNHKSHANYYDKGITVCERWKEFINFLSDMGERPEGKTLDRIDSNGNYEKDNCKWSTHKEQANNMSRNHYLEYKGEKLTISQWADKQGLPYNTLTARIRRGWSIERALTT